jgi:hypothetical protein
VVSNHLSDSVPPPPGIIASSQTVIVPQHRLDWTVSPEFVIGYHFFNDLGGVQVAYRFLAVTGSGHVTLGGIETTIFSRLVYNIFDFDYVSSRFYLDPWLTFQFYLGARVATNYFDTEATEGLAFQHESNSWAGAGPHYALEWEWAVFNCTDLALYARHDGALMFGNTRQHFNATFDDGTGNMVENEVTQSKSNGIPMLSVQLGISYRPFGFKSNALQLVGGYVYEQWWNLGKVNGSSGEVQSQGAFIGGQVDF